MTIPELHTAIGYCERRLWELEDARQERWRQLRLLHEMDLARQREQQELALAVGRIKATRML